MNVGFDLAYNSLVWLRTQSGTPTMAFDPDTSNLSPGFRFGFPVVEPAYYSNYGGFAYLMVNPDGSRVEFKSLEFLNVYSATDSSYAELVTTGDLIPSDPEAISMTLTTKDGTQTSFEWKAGAFRCSKIQDRNGNYITITHNSEGLLTKVIDTLGREINVTYDAQLYPLSITQTWKDGNGAGPGTSTHTWATFSYTTKIVATNFGSLINAGPPNGTVIKVLDKVTYADTSWTKFTYNGYIQVIKVENYADDDHLLNYVSTNLDAVSGTQPDCPRFTETRTMAEQFNNGNPVTVVNDAPVSATYNLPDGHNGPAAKIRVAVTGHPNGLYTNTYVRLSAGYSGPWDEGLTLATEESL